MHSRIFQLSTSPIDKDEYITESEFDENTGFIPAVADYVDERTNRDEDIKWFTSTKNTLFDKDNCTILFPKGFACDYFKPKYEKLKELINNSTLEEFSGINRDTMLDYYMKKCIEDKYGFYIYLQEETMYMTLDSFIRDYLEEDVPYYFGGTLDYHF